jgi:hypothetical protein
VRNGGCIIDGHALANDSHSRLTVASGEGNQIDLIPLEIQMENESLTCLRSFAAQGWIQTPSCDLIGDFYCV